jgi:hypothetical protein
MNLKACYKCKEEKPLSEFSKNKGKKDGLQQRCQQCVNQYYKENKEKIRARHALYRKNLPAAVYNIKNIVTGQVYIGQSTKFKERWSEHKRDLRLNIHPNSKLQEDYNKYGLDAFEFEVIKEFPSDTTSDVLLEEETRTIIEYARDRTVSFYNDRINFSIDLLREFLT